MGTLFERIAIIGVGLLGGSLALACKERQIAKSVVGYGRSKERILEAQNHGILDEGTNDLAEVAKQADLVVLCIPVQSIVPKVREFLEVLKPGTLLTDVGSVKGGLVRELESLMPKGVNYVGSHPIAGGELSGFKEARANLYQKALCVVTPTEKTDKISLQRVVQFWERIGAEVIALEPDEHDFIYGGVSHLPHALAFVLMNTIGGMKTRNHEKLFAFGGKGLLDYTRIASSDPTMWRDIFLANREVVLFQLKMFQNSLDSLVTKIEQKDGSRLLETFASANSYREELLKHKK